MNRQEMLLTLVSEECNEIGQRASKAIRFGLEEVQNGQELTNAERILGEYVDLMAVIGILTEEGVLPAIPQEALVEAIIRKVEKVEKYLDYSRQVGALTD